MMDEAGAGTQPRWQNPGARYLVHQAREVSARSVITNRNASLTTRRKVDESWESEG